MPAKLILNGRVLTALIMFAFFVTTVGVALGYPAQARFMPLVVGLPGIAFTLFELVKEVRRALIQTPTQESQGDTDNVKLPGDVSRLIGKDSVAVQSESQHFTPAELQKREWILLAYFTALIAGLLLFGFWIAAPLFVAIFLREREKAGWIKATLSAAAVLGVLYFVFYRGLGIDLHTGFVTDWLMDRLFPDS